MPEPKRIDIKEFREIGFLQELNRQFLHPLGLALEVIVEENGDEKLGGIWDYRGDPEGMEFADNMIEPEKVARVKELLDEKSKARLANLGYVLQPVPEGQL